MKHLYALNIGSYIRDYAYIEHLQALNMGPYIRLYTSV